LTAKTRESNQDADTPRPESLAVPDQHALGPQAQETGQLLAQSRQELKLEGELDGEDSSSAARRLDLFAYEYLTQDEASAGRDPPDIEG
jgi:hypothetical protein